MEQKVGIVCEGQTTMGTSGLSKFQMLGKLVAPSPEWLKQDAPCEPAYTLGDIPMWMMGEEIPEHLFALVEFERAMDLTQHVTSAFCKATAHPEHTKALKTPPRGRSRPARRSKVTQARLRYRQASRTS